MAFRTIQLQRPMISVVLLPNAVDREALIAVSALLNESADSGIQLSASCIPHISIAQFYAGEEYAAELWDGIKGQVGKVVEVQPCGLNFVPDSHGYIWTELAILKSRALLELQQAVMQTDIAQGVELHSPLGDVFRPHATLAVFEQPAQLPAVSLAGMDILNRPFTNVSLAVGVNGDNFTFVKVCHEA